MMGATESTTKQRPDPRRAKEIPEVPKGTPEAEYPRRMNCATAAQLLNVSVSYLRRLTKKCPAVFRYGARVTYDRELLLTWKPSARG